MKKYFIIFVLLIAAFLGGIYSQEVKAAAWILQIPQGATGTSTAQANAVFFGSSGGQFFTQDGNFTYATTSDTLTVSNLTVSTGIGSTGATTTFNGSGYFKQNLQVDGQFFAPVSLTSSGNATINGILSVASINSTSTTATSTFAGGLTVDTNSLVVDYFSSKVAIGQSTNFPATYLTIGANAPSSAIGNSEQLGIYSNSNNARLVIAESPNDSSGPAIEMAKSRGSLTGPTIVSADDFLGAVSFHGYTNAWKTDVAYLAARVDTGVGTGNDLPTYFAFFITPDGSATAAERMRITSAGNVGIGTTSPQEKLSVSGYGVFFATATSSACTNLIEGAIFYNQANGHFWGCVSGGTWKRLEVD